MFESSYSYITGTFFLIFRITRKFLILKIKTLFKRLIVAYKVMLVKDYFSTLLLKCNSFSLLVQQIVYFLSRQFQTSKVLNKK
jgi:hypothetical protein